MVVMLLDEDFDVRSQALEISYQFVRISSRFKILIKLSQRSLACVDNYTRK
jgi:hypothetical protein